MIDHIIKIFSLDSEAYVFGHYSRHQIDLYDRGSVPVSTLALCSYLKDISIIFYNFVIAYKLIGYYLKR